MNRLRLTLVMAALLSAACGTATGAQLKSHSNAGNVSVQAGANAGANVTVGSEDDQNRPNPPIRKSGPIPVPQSAQPAANGTQGSTTGGDRCSAGTTSPAAGARALGPGKHPPLPMCPVE